MSNRFLNALQTKPYLLADGATGTTLFAMGLKTGDAPELWNVEHPERIAELHRGFIDAGSDIILTNSFGGTKYRLKLHKAEDRVAEINEAAARIATEQARAADREVIVAGAMGPTGELFVPLGVLDFGSGRAAFAQQARALAAGGVDVLWIETLSSREEVEAAVAGAGVTGLPIVCSVSFDTNGSTMMGVTPADLAQICSELAPQPTAYGTNCGVGAAELTVCLLNLATASKPDSILVAKANCGIPEFVDGAIRYNGTPELMAEYATLVYDAGAKIIGGCCGTTAEHVRAMKAALDAHTKQAAPDVETIITRLGGVSTGALAQNRGEMDRMAGAAPGADAASRVRRRSRRRGS